jgi:hypothetical protein
MMATGSDCNVEANGNSIHCRIDGRPMDQIDVGAEQQNAEIEGDGVAGRPAPE